MIETIPLVTGILIGWNVLVLPMNSSVCLVIFPLPFWDQLVVVQHHMWWLGTSLAAPSTYHPLTPRSGAGPLFVQCLLPLAILPPTALAHQLKEETMHWINSYSTFRASGRCWFMKRIFHITDRKTDFRYTNFSTPPTTSTALTVRLPLQFQILPLC